MFDIRSPQPRIKFLSTDKGTSNNLANYVVSFQTQKHMNNLAGMFQMNLLPRFSSTNNVSEPDALSFCYKNIHPMDLISIGIEEDGGIMLGIVDNVFKTKMNYNNQVRRGITVRGRDFGKLLIEDNTLYVPSASLAFIHKLKLKLMRYGIINDDQDISSHPLVNMSHANRAPKAFDQEGTEIGRTFINRTPKEAIEYVLKSLTSLRLGYDFDGERNMPAYKLIESNISHRDGDLIAVESHNRFNGSIANFLYNLIDRDFYEIFIETYTENRSVLIVRPKPFDRDGDKVMTWSGKQKQITKDDDHVWDSLKTLLDKKEYHEIEEKDIIQSGMGVSDYEAFSLIIHNTRQVLMGQVMESFGEFFPLVDMFALQKYGLRHLKSNTQLASFQFKDDGNIKDQDKVEFRLLGNRDRLWNWNRYNTILESGNVTVRGHDYYKLGDRIYLKDELAKNGERGILAYCVGYSQRWQWGQNFLTTLNLIRGENGKLLNDFKELTKDTTIRAKAQVS